MLRFLLLLVLLATSTSFCLAAGFSFSEYEENDVAAEQAQLRKNEAQTRQLLSVPCASRLKNKHIAIMIGEQHRDRYYSYFNRTNSGPLFDEINGKLRALGLKTYTREQITEKIAEAEQTAFLNNDIDAAVSAAKRLKAQFLLQGRITVKSQRNRILDIDEVFLTLTLSLLDERGRQISTVSATADAFVDNDSLQTALQLARDKADLMLAQLYNDYCRQGK